MSPELINSRNGAKGYDGKQVDVWASGVLLIVMLLGTFPFDHTENPDPNTSEAHLEVWCAHSLFPCPVSSSISEFSSS
jgi:serine/threonine-protein kinase SRK2